MNCRSLHKEIVPYYSNELSPAERAAVERHLQLCPACARSAYDLSLAIRDARASRTAMRTRDLWPLVRESIEARPPLVPHPFLSLVFSLVLIGLLITDLRFMLPQRLSSAELQIVNEMEFLKDYDMWENLDVLEMSDLS